MDIHQPDFMASLLPCASWCIAIPCVLIVVMALEEGDFIPLEYLLEIYALLWKKIVIQEERYSRVKWWAMIL